MPLIARKLGGKPLTNGGLGLILAHETRAERERIGIIVRAGRCKDIQLSTRGVLLGARGELLPVRSLWRRRAFRRSLFARATKDTLNF